jgi:hypothetical protein
MVSLAAMANVIIRITNKESLIVVKERIDGNPNSSS